MPVHVQVPIRVRLGFAHLADMNVVEEAVAEAVERALARSREAVVDPRGPSACPAPKSPTYLWTGRAGDVEPTATPSSRCASRAQSRMRAPSRA